MIEENSHDTTGDSSTKDACPETGSCQITHPTGELTWAEGYILAFGACANFYGHILIRVYALTHDPDTSPSFDPDDPNAWESEDVNDPNPGDWTIMVMDDCEPPEPNKTKERQISVWWELQEDIEGGKTSINGPVTQNFTWVAASTPPDAHASRPLRPLGTPVMPVMPVTPDAVDGNVYQYYHVPVNNPRYGAQLMINANTPLTATEISVAVRRVHWRAWLGNRIVKITDPKGTKEPPQKSSNWRFRKRNKFGIFVFQPQHLSQVTNTTIQAARPIQLSHRLPIFVQVNTLRRFAHKSSGGFDLHVTKIQ